MSPEYIGQEVEVTLSEGLVRQPAAFRFEGRERRIVEVLAGWQDHGHDPDERRRHRWWQRHHRNWYRVKTEDGAVFDLLYERGATGKHPERRKWFLFQRVS